MRYCGAGTLVQGGSEPNGTVRDLYGRIREAPAIRENEVTDRAGYI